MVSPGFIFLLVSWDDFEAIFKANGRDVVQQEIQLLRQIIEQFTENGNIVNVNKLEFLGHKQESENDLLEEEVNECKDFCTVYGYLSKTRDEKITEVLPEDKLVKILYNYSLKDNENVRKTANIKYSTSQMHF